MCQAIQVTRAIQPTIRAMATINLITGRRSHGKSTSGIRASALVLDMAFQPRINFSSADMAVTTAVDIMAGITGASAGITAVGTLGGITVATADIIKLSSRL